LKNPTDSYRILKKQNEDLFNFVVTICYAVPFLKKGMNTMKQDDPLSSLIKADHFRHDVRKISEIKKVGTSKYKTNLAAYIILSSFSFFEAYFIDVLQEIVDFHGGKDSFINLAKSRSRNFMLKSTSDIVEHKAKLQEPIKPSKIAKYKKHSKELAKLGYRFPTELFAPYGVFHLLENLNNLKAYKVPQILKDGLIMDLDSATIETYNSIREIRNRIAHGKKGRLTLKKALEINSFLHDLATKIDQHLIANFFIIEKYA
jgi:hypothetical protein